MNYFRIAGIAVNSITARNLMQEFQVMSGFDWYISALVSTEVLEKGFFPKVSACSRSNSRYYGTSVIGIPTSEHWRITK